MKRLFAVTAFNFVFVLTWFSIAVSAQAPAAQAHVAAAKAAALPSAPNAKPYQNFTNMVEQFCAQPKGPDVVRPDSERFKPLPRDQWYVPPYKIFDNLYFIGTKAAGIYALDTSDGIIMIDTNFDWDVEELVAGLLQYGLSPADIKYIIITHAHDDRYWGARTLQDKYPNAHVIMSEADWNVVAKDTSPAKFKPRKDMVATDGQKLTLGDTTVSIYITPGHTPGTLSLIFPLTYGFGKEKHTAAMWGGTDYNIGRQGVQYWPDGKTFFRTYIASVNRFKMLVDAAGVDTIIPQNMGHTNAIERISELRNNEPDSSGQSNALAERLKRGEVIRHPLVSKDDVNRYYTIVRECAEAQLAWRNGS
jgi:glyoxylase-like metal-dependent hydrolase (beta-lactamase superfamily II)